MTFLLIDPKEKLETNQQCRWTLINGTQLINIKKDNKKHIYSSWLWTVLAYWTPRVWNENREKNFELSNKKMCILLKNTQAISNIFIAEAWNGSGQKIRPWLK